MSPKRSSRRTNAPQAPVATDLLSRAVEFYHGCLSEADDIIDFLRDSRLDQADLPATFQLGACTGRLKDILPDPERDPDVHATLKKLGLLTPEGQEKLTGCLTVPLLDGDGGMVGIAGIDPKDDTEHVLADGAPWIWNMPAVAVHADLIATCSIQDALAIAATGVSHVIGFAGRPGDTDLGLLQEHGVTSVTFAAPQKPAREYAKPLKGIACSALSLPKDQAPRVLLRKLGPDKFSECIDAAPSSVLHDAGREPVELLSDGVRCKFSGRRYELRGIDKRSRKLNVAVRAEHQNRLHVDTVDLYSARARRNLSVDLCRFFEEAREVIDADIDRMIRLSERWIEEHPDEDITPAVVLSEKDIGEARAFGTAPNLLELLQADYEACGLVGEESNKLLCYLAAVSRKMPEPLSILILSSSGAGKSALQETTLKLCPPEDVVKLTSMTGRALFYKARKSLKHKILAMEEEAGAEGAAYPLRALISSGELIIETTIKDLGSGQLTTVQNRVEGPASVFITTTSPDTDPETRSRFFVTSVDESREQTRRILEFQRHRFTLGGQSDRMAAETVIRRHRNFQRLLQPVAVINPFAGELTFGDDRLQSRRNQPKFLNLIATVAFLRQMTKPVRTMRSKQGARSYIEVDAEDMEIADDLARRVLRRHLDDLNPVSFDLLGEIRRLVRSRIDAAQIEGSTPPQPTEIRFTRRELREFSGWPHVRVRRYLGELVEMEFLSVISGRRGSAYRYALSADVYAQPGQPGQGWSDLVTAGDQS